MAIWKDKYRFLFKPTYYDNILRQNDSRNKKLGHNYRTADPIWFDHDKEHTNNGIQHMIDLTHEKGYKLPVKNMALILYNMSYKEIYDPTLYEGFESVYPIASTKHCCARVCYGALSAYYKSNQGTLYGVDYWESLLEDNLESLHV